MAAAPLSFDTLSATLSSAIDEIIDPRKPSNATRYSVKDAVMGAFSCFFMALLHQYRKGRLILQEPSD